MKQTVRVSDLSGETSNGAELRVFGGGETFTLDVTDGEAREFAAKGRAQKRRGRPPKASEPA